MAANYPACNSVRPRGPASILPHCSFTTGCQWHSLNNVDCSGQKAIQFKTCFALVPSQRAFRTCRLPLSLSRRHTCTQIKCKHADAESPSAAGDGRVAALRVHCLTFTTLKQMTGPYISFTPTPTRRRNTVPPNHLASANMTELCLKLWLLDDDTLRDRWGKLAPQ